MNLDKTAIQLTSLFGPCSSQSIGYRKILAALEKAYEAGFADGGESIKDEVQDTIETLFQEYGTEIKAGGDFRTLEAKKEALLDMSQLL